MNSLCTVVLTDVWFSDEWEYILLYVSYDSHTFASTVCNPRKGKSGAKKSTIPIPGPGRNDESSSRAPFGQGFGENSTVNPLSGSARFKIYRPRVIFAIPTRRSQESLLFVGEHRGDDRERLRRTRELHKHARTRRGTNGGAAAAPVVHGRWYVTPYPTIVKLGPKTVVTSDRAKRQIIIGDTNVASGS